MVDILHYELANKNKTIGYVDISIPIVKPTILIFRKIAHVQSGDRRWFNLPTFVRDVVEGQVYPRYAEFETQAYNTQLMEGLSEKVKEYCQKNNIKEIEAMDFEAIVADSECPF
jgi:hypothetical protein